MVRLLLPSIAMALAAPPSGPAKHTMKKLVAFDLDDTLLNPEHRLTQPTLDKLRELDGLGVSIVFATGRSAPAVYEHVAALGILNTLPCVLYNGAVCYAFPQPCDSAKDAAARKEELFSLGIDLADAAAVCAFAAERDLLVQYYVGDHIYVRPTCDEHRDLVRRYHELTGASHTTVDEYPLTESPAKMLLMTDDPDGVLAIVREAQASGALPSGLASIRGSPPFFVEMLGTGVYKGSGLAKLCERRGIAMDDVIAFGRARRPFRASASAAPQDNHAGDGENDVEFVRDAGLGVAMKNGRDAVKSVAGRVTARTNAEDGVAHELSMLQAEGVLPSTATWYDDTTS